MITCVSSPEVQTAAVELLATHGRLNFFAGLGQGGVVPIDTNRLHYKGLVLTGTTGSSNADYSQALALVGDGRADVEQLVSRTFADRRHPRRAGARGVRAGHEGHGRLRRPERGAVMNSVVMALDSGTTSIRAILFDHDGEVVAAASQEFPQIYPQPGWVEHNPLDIWNTQVTVAKQALAQAGLTARDVAAIGVTNQRETTVLWDRATGEPVMNAIVWQDRRTAGVLRRAQGRGPDEHVRSHHRAGGRRLLLRHQAGLDARPRARASGSAPSAASWPSAPWTAG